jgi:hypothetical protein
MTHWHNDPVWFWMIPMMLFGILLLGSAVYAAVRLANRDSHRH